MGQAGMMRREVLLFRRALLVFDVAVTAASFLLTYYLRAWLAFAENSGALPGPLAELLTELSLPQLSAPEGYRLVMVAVVPLWALTLYMSGTMDFRLSYRKIFVRYARAVALGLALLVGVFFFLKLHFVGRSFVAMFGAVNLVALIVARYIVMETAAFVRNKQVDPHRVLIVGCAEDAVTLAHALNPTKGPWKCKVLGHVAIPGQEADDRAQPVWGDVESLGEILDREPIDEVLFTEGGLDREQLDLAVHACNERGVDVLLPLPTTTVHGKGRMEIATFEGYDTPLLGVRHTPTGDLRLTVKRGMDIVGSLILLILASPLMIATAIGIKLSSKGPVLFRQERSGKHGRRFVMMKFRSMVVDAEQQRTSLMHLNEMSGPVFKIRRDPRVTRIGNLIRKTSIDELPQLFNVFRGDMSLVGPRPPIPAEVEQYKPWQRRRLSVKPGLTGLWQVSGRNDVDFDEWMKMDLRYIDNWSLWQDVLIIIRTVPAVLFRTGL